MIITGVYDCGSGKTGTWFPGCKITPKDYTKAFLLSPMANIDLATDDFDEAARSLLIKKGWLVAINDAEQVTEAGAKSNFKTLPNKKKIFVSSGLYEFSIELEANMCAVKAMHKLAKKSWQLLLLDSEGKLIFDRKNGKLKGFEINDMSVGNETVNDGGSKTATFMIDLQLTADGTVGYNERKDFILSDEFYDIVGIQDVTLSDDTLTIANLLVTVLSGCDGATPTEGLTTPNFRVRDAATNVNVPITIVEIGNGQYKIVGATVGARIIQLYDLVVNSGVADILQTQFYQSNELAVVLV